MISEGLAQVLARARAKGIRTHLDPNGRVVVHDRRDVHNVQRIARDLEVRVDFASGRSGESDDAGRSGESPSGTTGYAFGA